MLTLHISHDQLQSDSPTKRPLFGLLNSVAHPTIVEMIACAGYDFVILDMEHLPHHETLLAQCIQIAQLNGCAPLVRIAEGDIAKVGRILDMGAHGIVLSRTETAQQVKALRNAMYFPPRGKRGITGGTVTGFGTLPLGDYIEQANRGLLLIPMIESQRGVENIADILAAGDVSLVMEGALDLAMDLQLGPIPHHPDVERHIQHLATQCKNAAIPFCANPRTPEQQHYWQQAGIRLWLCGEDRGFLFRTLKQRLQDIRTAR